MKILKLKKIKPMFNRIVTTGDCFTKEDATINGIFNDKIVGTFKPIQTILSLGDSASARGLKEGDVVSLDFSRYGRAKQVKDKNSIKESMETYTAEIMYEVPVILINDEDCLYLTDGDVEYVIEDFEYVEQSVGSNKAKKLNIK